MDPTQQLSLLVSEANTLYQKGLPAEALQAYQKAHALAPAHADVSLGMATCEAKLGHPDAAVDHLRKAVKLYPPEKGLDLMKRFAGLLTREGAHRQAAYLLAARMKAITPTTDDVQEAVLAHLRAEDWSGAEALLTTHLPAHFALWPDVLRAEGLGAEARANLQAWDRSLAALVSPSLPEAQAKAADAYLAVLTERPGDSETVKTLVGKWQSAQAASRQSASLTESLAQLQALQELFLQLGHALVNHLQQVHAANVNELQALQATLSDAHQLLSQEQLAEQVGTYLAALQALRQRMEQPETALAAYAEQEEKLEEGRALSVQTTQALVGQAHGQVALGKIAAARQLADFVAHQAPDTPDLPKLRDRIQSEKAALDRRSRMILIAGVSLIAIFAVATMVFSGDDAPAELAASPTEPNANLQTAQVEDAPFRPLPGGQTSGSYAKGLQAWVDQLRLRQAPSPQAKVIAGIREGEIVQDLDQRQGSYQTTLKGRPYTGSWLKVRMANGMVGWAFSKAFKEIGNIRTYPEAVINDPDGYTNLRMGPGTDHGVITQVRDREVFEVLTQAGDWWQVRTEHGKVGYMHRSRVRLRTQPSGLPGQFPEASQRTLTQRELQQYQRSNLRLMRNEIFARYGYRFRSDDLARHFARQPWYRPRYDNVDDRLTALERANVALIRAVEDS